MEIRDEPVQSPPDQAPIRTVTEISSAGDIEEIQEIQEISEEKTSGDSGSLFDEDINPDTEATFDLQAEFAAASRASVPMPPSPPDLPVEAAAATAGYIKATDSIHVDSAMFNARPETPAGTASEAKAVVVTAAKEKKPAPKKKYTVTVAENPAPEPVRAKKHVWFAIPVIVLLVVAVSAVILWQLLKGMDVQRQAAAGIGQTAGGDAAASHYSKGNHYFESQQYYLAMDEYKTALKMNPNLALAYRGLGAVLGKLGKTDEAVKEYEQYLKLVPSAPDANNVKKIVNEYYGK